MAKQSPAQQKSIEGVMHEHKHGELKNGRSGKRVKSRKQAIAIALSEVGASKYQGKGKAVRQRKKS